jgi:sialate O-acetylesterase
MIFCNLGKPPAKRREGEFHMRHLKSLISMLIIALFLNGTGLYADITLPAIFGENMVMQRDRQATLWGWADAGEKIKIECSWYQRGWETTADAGGNWKIKIDPPRADRPGQLKLTGKNTVEINNILAGEVWVCSGQSNMEWPLRAAVNAEAEIKAANYPQIRLFTVTKKTADQPQKDCTGHWTACRPETAANFSAVGYFFGRHLHQELNVPIGLINTSWGGTPAQSWTSEPWLRKMADYQPALEQLKYNHANLKEVQAQFEEKNAQWQKDLIKLDAGRSENGPGWEAPQLDDKEWPTVELPGDFAKINLGPFDGSVWYRREINLPDDWAGRELTLELGPIDDMDITWINGTKVGGHETPGHWQTPRKYKVPADAVKKGANVIAVRVLDNSGAGGFTGKPEQMRIYPTDAEAQAVSLTGEWRFKVGFNMKDQPPRPAPPLLATSNPWAPTSLYNGMIAPLAPYTIAGAIWYQGESNAGQAYQYRELFPTMIRSWRDVWGQGDFPFLFVQLAPFQYGEPLICAELREAQTMTLSLPNTGMAVTMDIGNPTDIHPRNKQDVGKRLALWALAKTYGRQDLVYSGPLYKSMQVEGDKVRLSFDHTGTGLLAKDKPLTHFTIAGPDKKFLPAIAQIDGETIIVQNPKIQNPVAVRYGWTNDAQPNLFNKERLPASPFRTDDWPGVTQGR